MQSFGIFADIIGQNKPYQTFCCLSGCETDVTASIASDPYKHSASYTAEKVLTNDDEEALEYNYWASEESDTTPKYIIIDLGCVATISQIELRNSYNAMNPGSEL